MKNTVLLVVGLAILGGLSGCIVVKPVVGAGAAVGSAAVKTTAKVTKTAAGAVVDAAVPDSEKSEESSAKK